MDIKHNQEAHQFLVDIDGKVAKLDYSVAEEGKSLDFQSTFVPPELRGQKIGDKIVLFALNYARDHQLKVIPTCPFVKTVVERHPEYRDLLIAD